MRIPYSFGILRYVHDPVTQEFVNIGVVVYSQQAAFLRAICTTNYGRITRLFEKISGDRFRQLVRYVEDQINATGKRLSGQLPFEPSPFEQLLARVLPPDDSSIQFSSPFGVGLSSDLEKTLDELFDRYVERYASRVDESRRSDEEVWRVFREPLERFQVTPSLTAKRIEASNYDYEFGHAWKNEIWHVYEPVSLDLSDAGSILDKANRWVGRATSLNDSSERFKIHLLLGAPQADNLQGAFVKAQNILRNMPGQREFHFEHEAESFAEDLASELHTYEH
jgi:hypothetical protein